MAQACRNGIEQKTDGNAENDQDENFCFFNVLCVFISLVTILADLTTDILVFAEYCQSGYKNWALVTLTLILTPNILINAFSMRWLVIDHNSSTKLWITHGFLLGFIERHIVFLYNILACKNLESKTLSSQRNDLNLLHMLYIFTGTIPQIILLAYAIVYLDGNYYTKVFSLAASNVSVIWGCGTYIYSMMINYKSYFKWIALLLQLVWHFGMLIARIFGILLFVIMFGIWTLLPFCLHWTAMTFWIVVQNTSFCPNKIEETLYNIVMGFVHCFSFINLQRGHTKYRLLMYYTLVVSQNFGSLFLYVLLTDTEQQNKPWSIAATSCIIGSTVIGLTSMVLYYRYFHPNGPIIWKYPNEDIELNNKVNTLNTNTNICSNLKHARSFKSAQKTQNNDTRMEPQNSNPAQQIETESTDKKILLEHIARSGTPTFKSAPVGNITMNTSCSVEMYSVENTPQPEIFPKANRKITYNSPKLNVKSLESLESSIDELTISKLNIQKRRGICSSDELREDLIESRINNANMTAKNINENRKNDLASELSHNTESSNKKTSSDSIDMDLDLSFSDINSSDINTFNENIVQKLCLSALKNIKVGNQDADIENIQRIALDILKEMYSKKDKNKSVENFPTTPRDIDTPTEILSVHDYENICAVNIAREAWGLRSWNGYFDIENWLHDGSVVREHRRDTLTSGSSEISSCISQDLRNAILLAPPFSKKSHTYSNVFVKFDVNNQSDYVNTVNCISNDETFLAKPCIVDGVKEPIHLEPILEELDDLGDIESSCKKRMNSESSLVATIDEIRKVTVTNSPRNIYHRRELYDSPQISISSKFDYDLQHALWKEPSKFDSSNIMQSLPDKENICHLNEPNMDFHNKQKDKAVASSSLSLNLPNSNACFSINRACNSANNSNPSRRINNDSSHHGIQDLLNKDIDFLWQLVSENSTQLSNGNLSSSKRTSSMQSLIQKDNSTSSLSRSTPKVSNIKKAANKPRRKFSILRERFEHKTNFNADEEILRYYSDDALNQTDSLCDMMATELNSVNTSDKTLQKIDSNVSPKNMNSGNTGFNQANNSFEPKNIKDKRSLFMKQVLSPPKFNSKLKQKF